MKFIARIFWDYKERRIRTLWRLVLFALMGLIITTILLLSSQAVVVGIGVVTLEQFANLEIFPKVAGSLLAIWLAGRLLDRRRFVEFGLHFNKDWWCDLGFGLFLGGLLITIIFLIELAAGWITITGTFVTGNPDSTFAVAILFQMLIFMLGGFEEELFYRGYILTNVSEGLNWKRFGPRWAVVIATILSASLFALLHANSPNASAMSAIIVFLGGIILALGYILTGELAISIGFHITWNFFQASVYGFMVSGMDFDAATIFSTQQHGPELWVGNAFGPESGLLALGALALGCLLIVLWVHLRYGRVRLHMAIADAPEMSTKKIKIASVEVTAE
jgi:membrane protease YdiL (CAAX protease family)